jgi:hypothetical protein
MRSMSPSVLRHSVTPPLPGHHDRHDHCRYSRRPGLRCRAVELDGLTAHAGVERSPVTVTGASRTKHPSEFSFRNGSLLIQPIRPIGVSATAMLGREHRSIKMRAHKVGPFEMRCRTGRTSRSDDRSIVWRPDRHESTMRQPSRKSAPSQLMGSSLGDHLSWPKFRRQCAAGCLDLQCAEAHARWAADRVWRQPVRVGPDRRHGERRPPSRFGRFQAHPDFPGGETQGAAEG